MEVCVQPLSSGYTPTPWSAPCGHCDMAARNTLGPKDSPCQLLGPLPLDTPQLSEHPGFASFRKTFSQVHTLLPGQSISVTRWWGHINARVPSPIWDIYEEPPQLQSSPWDHMFLKTDHNTASSSAQAFILSLLSMGGESKSTLLQTVCIQCQLPGEHSPQYSCLQVR